MREYKDVEREREKGGKREEEWRWMEERGEEGEMNGRKRGKRGRWKEERGKRGRWMEEREGEEGEMDDKTQN